MVNELYKAQEGIGEFGEKVPGPPWILGHRGAPREAPENTLASLRRALELGLDGVEYDLHARASGEAVLIHDETLERTTSGKGPVAELTLPELAGIDAGSSFSKEFAGEPLPLFEEALDLPGNRAGTFPQHMIEIKDPGLVAEVARALGTLARPLTVRVASFHRRVCLEARDCGLPTMLLTTEARAEDLAFVRDERIQAYGTAPGGFDVRAGALDWPCERWSWSVDEPADLLAAMRRPLSGLNTNEPRRALAARALARRVPEDRGAWPLEAPPLEVPIAGTSQPAGRHGEWSGRWTVEIGVRNPFPFRVEVALALAVRGGAFEVAGLPEGLVLEPGERRACALSLAGGSWSPHEDPALFARFAWRAGPGRPEEALILDAPLARTRTLRLSSATLRVPMLREHPGAPAATMTVRRRGREVLAAVEDAGGLQDVRALLRIGHEVLRGAAGVRGFLPDLPPGRAIPFSVGFEGRARSAQGEASELRRWSGGLPYGLGAGAPGRLFVLEQA
jgi:glycerophosphoryl diester phosphodiesterase